MAAFFIPLNSAIIELKNELQSGISGSGNYLACSTIVR